MKAIEIISRHVVASLPDSIRERKRLLEALMEITKDKDAKAELFSILNTLQRHETRQQEFAFGGAANRDGEAS